MNSVDERLNDGRVIAGHYASGFKSILTAFRANFNHRNEVGASVCLTQNGNTVVDLWGGLATGTVGPDVR